MREMDSWICVEYPGAKSISKVCLCVQLTLMSGLGNSYLALLPHSAPFSLLYNTIHLKRTHTGPHTQLRARVCSCVHVHAFIPFQVAQTVDFQNGPANVYCDTNPIY